LFLPRAAGKSAAETVAVMMAVFRRLDPRLRASITFDNDTTFARHGLLANPRHRLSRPAPPSLWAHAESGCYVTL
jgi:IS30 family transposase